MNLHLNISGVILLLLAIIHVGFPRYFQWKKELAGLSLINRQLMEVHTLFIALAVALMGAICLLTNPADWQNSLGSLVASGLSLFWLVRLLVQLFYYSPKLWNGRVFETIMHIVFTVLWLYLTIIFFFISRLYG
ncbi:MAG: hypothetical protein ACK4E0_10565 [Chitinophagaceae bacterium]